MLTVTTDQIEGRRIAEYLGIVGIELDYETAGGSMLMASANGTAVRLE